MTITGQRVEVVVEQLAVAAQHRAVPDLDPEQRLDRYAALNLDALSEDDHAALLTVEFDRGRAPVELDVVPDEQVAVPVDVDSPEHADVPADAGAALGQAVVASSLRGSAKRLPTPEDCEPFVIVPRALRERWIVSRRRTFVQSRSGAVRRRRSRRRGRGTACPSQMNDASSPWGSVASSKARSKSGSLPS